MITELTVFLPAFNEAKNLPQLVRSCDHYLKKNLKKYEIIVINDGSTDETAKVTTDLKKKYPSLRLINHPSNLGYGLAIKNGIIEARFDWVFFMDSDNQFRIDDLHSFLSHDEADLVIGYRMKRDDPINRLIASRVYGIFVKTLFGLWIRDIDCAFKLMRKEAVQHLGLISHSFFISTELLVRAKKKGLKIVEIGVNHYPRREGKSTVTKERIFQSLIELKNLYLSI